jgi:hypothetical protein
MNADERHLCEIENQTLDVAVVAFDQGWSAPQRDYDCACDEVDKQCSHLYRILCLSLIPLIGLTLAALAGREAPPTSCRAALAGLDHASGVAALFQSNAF